MQFNVALLLSRPCGPGMGAARSRAASVTGALIAAASLSGAPSAHAQFSSPSLFGASSNTPGGGAALTAGPFSLGLYAYAPFQFNASVRAFPINLTGTNSESGETATVQETVGGSSASFTANGVLLAPDYHFGKEAKNSIFVGGWYWLHDQNKSESYSGKFDADLYDLHVRYMITAPLGIEIGYLGQTNDSIPKQEGVNAYVSYAVLQGDPNKAKGNFSLTVGLGVQDVEKTTLNFSNIGGSSVDESYTFGQTTDFAGYIEAAYSVMPRGTINLSYWLLSGSQNVDVSASETSGSVSASGSGSTSQSRTVSRLGLGFGYQF